MFQRFHSQTPPCVAWTSQTQALTLGGETVLHYELTWPTLQSTSPACRCLSAYYRRMAKAWEARWQREVYCRACLELAQRRAASKPFFPWQGRLTGEVAHLTPELISVHFHGWERQGNGKTCHVSWGDVWNWHTGAPCSLRDFYDKEAIRKKSLAQQVTQLGLRQQQEGSRFFRPNWTAQVKKELHLQNFWISPEGVHIPFPQCTLCPAAEEAPDFLLPLSAPSV